MSGPILASTFSCSMLPFIFLAPAWGAHYDSRKLGDLTANSSRLQVPAPASSEADAADHDFPVDMDELGQLCHTVGLNRACLALAVTDAISTKPVLIHPKEAERGVQRGAAAGTLSACLPPGQLVFAHVMKTGGLTVD